jgi:hypothetical protein
MGALIDSYPRGARPRPSKREIHRKRLEEFRSGNARQRVLWLRDRLLRVRARIRNPLYFWSGYCVLGILAKTGLPMPRWPWNLVLVASSRAAKLYTPPPSEVRVELFQPQTAPSSAPTPWEGIAGEVVLHQLIGPGTTHDAITRGEGAPTLVKYLTAALHEAMSAAVTLPVQVPNGNGATGQAELNGATDRLALSDSVEVEVNEGSSP